MERPPTPLNAATTGPNSLDDVPIHDSVEGRESTPHLDRSQRPRHARSGASWASSWFPGHRTVDTNDVLLQSERGSWTANPPRSIWSLLCDWRRCCQSCCGEFKEHHRRLRMFRRASANRKWPEVFGTSPWFPKGSPWLLIIRATLACLFLFVEVWSIIESWQGGYWFIYLTHWSLTIETLYLCMAAFTSYVAWKLLNAESTQEAGRPVVRRSKLPWYVVVTWILHHIAMPASLMVMSLYWTLLNPPWSATFVMPHFGGFFAHLINFWLLLFELLLGRNVFYLTHVPFFFAYSLLYFAWSYVDFAAKIGTADPCTISNITYASNECPIYAPLNWHRPEALGITAFVVILFVIPLCQFPLWWCARARRAADFLQHDLATREAPLATASSTPV